jgi:hypothetical protein
VTFDATKIRFDERLIGAEEWPLLDCFTILFQSVAGVIGAGSIEVVVDGSILTSNVEPFHSINFITNWISEIYGRGGEGGKGGKGKRLC